MVEFKNCMFLYSLKIAQVEIKGCVLYMKSLPLYVCARTYACSTRADTHRHFNQSSPVGVSEACALATR